MMKMRTTIKRLKNVKPGDIWVQEYFGGTVSRLVLYSVPHSQKDQFMPIEYWDFKPKDGDNWIILGYLQIGQNNLFNTIGQHSADLFLDDSKFEILKI